MTILFTPRVMVTGHRPQHVAPDRQEWARAELDRIAEKLRHENGMTTGISGMAIGADTWWAWSVLGSGAQLWAFVPFPQQADRWSHSQLLTWQYLLSRATRINETATEYSVGALHQRNDQMLAESNLVVAVWSPSKLEGGTASCVEKARRLGKPLIVVDLDQMSVWAERLS